MCGPIEKCCCCFPAKVGVNFIGGILIIVELGALIYSTVILKINNKVRELFIMTTFPSILINLVIP